MSNNDGEKIWGYIVLIASAILAVIFIFKILFWVSLIGIVIGVVWFYLERDNDTNYSLLLIIICILLAFISYGIGYYFEQTNFGNSVVTAAENIVQADNTIKDIPNNILDNISKTIPNRP